MLSVLAFKRSLFAGVLDGGVSEVSLHGTRRTYLKLPAPAPETLQRLAGALATLLSGLRQR